MKVSERGNMPKVSVIIPVYNAEKYLRQCLDSVVNQTLKDIEIVCVNDGSPDNSLSILEEYASKDERIKIINQENQGQGYARNRALENACGDYIMFLDSDDFFEDEISIESAYNQIEKYGNDVAIFRFNDYIEHSGKKRCSIKEYKDFLDKNNIDINNFVIKNLVDFSFVRAAACNKIYNRNFLVNNNIKFLEGYKLEDLYFLAKVAQYSESASVFNKPLINYRRNIESTCHTINGKEYADARIKTLDILKNEETDFKVIIKCVIFSINAYEYRLNNFIKKRKRNISLFYTGGHNLFRYLSENYEIEKIKSAINYHNFKLICKYDDFKKYEIIRLLTTKLFFVCSIGNNLYITVLGVRLKFKNFLKYRM